MQKTLQAIFQLLWDVLQKQAAVQFQFSEIDQWERICQLVRPGIFDDVCSNSVFVCVPFAAGQHDPIVLMWQVSRKRPLDEETAESSRHKVVAAVMCLL